MKSFLASVTLLAIALAVPANAGEVKLQVANGRITLQARDATVREILAEWARVGQVKIVNGERIAGAPMTLDLQGVPEAQALNTLLRSVTGYMAAPKAAAVAGASIYDRIIIMAAPRALTASASYTTPPPQQPPYRPGMPPGMANPTTLDGQDEPPGPPPTYPGGGPVYPGAVISRGTIVLGQPGAPVTPPAAGAIPQGSPGTVSPMPQLPGMPGQPMALPPTGAPGTVTPPVKKPGGPGGSGPGGDGGE
jgi:hypothetical protein